MITFIKDHPYLVTCCVIGSIILIHLCLNNSVPVIDPTFLLNECIYRYDTLSILFIYAKEQHSFKLTCYLLESSLKINTDILSVTKCASSLGYLTITELQQFHLLTQEVSALILKFQGLM